MLQENMYQRIRINTHSILLYIHSNHLKYYIRNTGIGKCTKTLVQCIHIHNQCLVVYYIYTILYTSCALHNVFKGLYKIVFF